jgi:hypothetical protein
MASDMFMASIDAWFEQASQRLKGQKVDGNNGNNGNNGTESMQTPAQKIAAARASRVMAGTSVQSVPSASVQSSSAPQCRPEPKLDFAVSSVVRRFNDFKRDQEKKAHSKKFKGI